MHKFYTVPNILIYLSFYMYIWFTSFNLEVYDRNYQYYKVWRL